MIKNIILLSITLISNAAFSQVGIDTDQPKATLDIKASPTNANKTDGLIAPRLTGDQLKANDSKYGIDQTGAIIYAITAVAPTTAKTVNVTNVGYYYFDGNIWQKFNFGADNTIDSWIDDSANSLLKLGTKSDGVSTRDAGTEIVATDNGRIGIGTATPEMRLDIPDGQTRMGKSTEFQVRQGPGYIDFFNSTGTLKSNVAINNNAGDLWINSFTFSPNTVLNGSSGNVGIGVATPSKKLHIQTTGTPSAPVTGFRLVDGNQGANKILTSDDDGVGTWTPLKLFTGTTSNGVFSWTHGTDLGNTNWNSIASLDLQPNTTYMVYAKLHFINVHPLGAARSYIGKINLGTNNPNVGGETPIQGSWQYDPLPSLYYDFETTKSFVYTTDSTANPKIYLNLQSDDQSIQRSIYITGSPASYKGVFIDENYFFVVPIK